MSKVARTIRFFGRVQGVGFRMTAVHLARDLPLAGTVRNLPDGGVELVVTGEAAEIDKWWNVSANILGRSYVTWNSIRVRIQVLRVLEYE